MLRILTPAAAVQQDLAEALQLLGYSPVLEWSPPGLPVSMDAVIHGVDSDGKTHAIAVEMDGPSHFTLNGELTAKTRARNLMFLLHGYEVRAPSN
jgi:hypothetical protein